MNRRTFHKLAGLAAMGVIAESAEVGAQSSPSPPGPGTPADSEVILEDESLLVAFDRSSGVLTRFENKSTHWVIERPPELGMSFRMLVPLPERRANFVYGLTKAT